MVAEPEKIFIKGRNENGCIYVRNKSIIEEMPNMSNNQCEWKSLVMAMKFILDYKLNNVIIFTDSVLLYKQLSGKISDDKLLNKNKKKNRIKSKKLKHIYFEWNKYKNLLYDKSISYKYIDFELNPARCYV